METKQFTFTVLWYIALALPYLIFAVHNSFRIKWLTFLRATIAILIGWAYFASYAIAANSINICFAKSTEEILSIYDGDGSKLAMAAVFGWVVPTIIVILSWLFHVRVLPKLALTRRSSGTP